MYNTRRFFDYGGRPHSSLMRLCLLLAKLGIHSARDQLPIGIDIYAAPEPFKHKTKYD